MNQENTFQKIKDAVNFTAFFSDYSKEIGVSNFRPNADGWVYDLYNPFYSHSQQKNKSFTININTGMYNDLGGRDDKGDIFEFYQKIHNVEKAVALSEIASKYTNIELKKSTNKRSYSDADLERMTEDLLDNPKYIAIKEYLRKAGVTDQIIKELKIGAGTRKFWQPIKNKYGNPVRGADGKTKGEYVDRNFIHYTYTNGNHYFQQSIEKVEKEINGNKVAKFNKPNKYSYGLKVSENANFTVFPFSPQDDDNKDIILCAGERDCLGLRSMGYNAYTYAHGESGGLNSKVLAMFTDKNVTIVYDRDPAGEKGAKQRAELLSAFSNSVKYCSWSKLKTLFETKYRIFPKFDFTDFYEQNGSKYDFDKYLETAQEYVDFHSAQIKLQQDDNIEELRENLAPIFYSGKNGKLNKEAIVKYLMESFTMAFTEVGGRGKRTLFIYRDGFWEETHISKLETMIQDITLEDITSNQIADIIKQLSARTYVDFDIFDQRDDLLNLNNCVYDLENLTALPHDPDYYFTFKTSYNYDEDAKCENWLTALDKYSMKDEIWKEALQKQVGYSILGHNKREKMIWWVGIGGRNGKGTTIEILNELIGDKYFEPEFTTKNLTAKFNMGRFIGKRIVVDPDASSQLDNVSKLKSLTGNDKFASDVKFGDMVYAKPKFTPILAFNIPPKLPDDEDPTPVLKRVLYLEWRCELKDTEIDPEFKIKIKDEMSGIFNWAIEGLKKLKNDDNFTYPEQHHKFIRFFERTANTFSGFLQECVWKAPSYISGEDLWQLYCNYMNIYADKHWMHPSSNVKVNSRHKFTQQINILFKTIELEKGTVGKNGQDKNQARREFTNELLKNNIHNIYCKHEWDTITNKKCYFYYGIGLTDDAKEYIYQYEKNNSNKLKYHYQKRPEFQNYVDRRSGKKQEEEQEDVKF